MSPENQPKLRLKIRKALDELQGLIESRYPTATFRIERGQDSPTSIHLVTTIDEDPDSVLDVVMDRLLALQVEGRLPIHVIPVAPIDVKAGQLRHEDQKSHDTPPYPPASQ